jgi:hypothetical protein
VFDETLRSKVNREVGRINGELCDLHELEESTKVRRARLEVEMRQAIAMRDMFEVLGRLDKLPPNAFEQYLAQHPTVATNKPVPLVSAPRLVEPAHTSVDARHKHKPDGLPSIAAMVETVLRDAPGGLRPCDITAAIRQRWWADLAGPVVSSTVWHMAERGRLAKTGSTYRLPSTSQTNGSGHSARAIRVASTLEQS